MEEQKMEEGLDATKNINSYNTTRIKSRNFLTNISYNKVKEEDLIMKKKKKSQRTKTKRNGRKKTKKMRMNPRNCSKK